MTKYLAILAALLLASGAVAAPPTTPAPAPNVWVVPKALCPNFATSAAKACVEMFRVGSHNFADLDENGQRNVIEVCMASQHVSNVVCEKGAVKLDRSSVKTFCQGVSASYGATASIGCEVVVSKNKDLNSPEEFQETLAQCKVIGRAVFEFAGPVCEKRFSEKGLPPKLTPDPEPKAQPKSSKPPPFKPGEETSI